MIYSKRVVRNSEINRIINDAYHGYKPDNIYPIIVIIVYLLCLIYFLSTNNLPIETTDIIYMYIIFLTVMIFAFPIAMFFDIVIDVRFNKKCKKLKNNKFAMMKNETEGIIFNNTQFEDILIFILILLIMYLVFAILN